MAEQADSAAEKTENRPVEGVSLPWQHGGIWPYSAAVGEAPPPEVLLQTAVAQEAEKRYYSAYHAYRRILVEYPNYHGRDVLTAVYLGMIRTLWSMGREHDAADLTLKMTAPGHVLYGNSEARGTLELALAFLHGKDEKIENAIKSRLDSWPKERRDRQKTPEVLVNAKPVVVDDKDVPPPDYDKTASDLFERVRFYQKTGDVDSARIYVDVLASRFPDSRYVGKARALVDNDKRGRK
jgi:hypothetical protein